MAPQPRSADLALDLGSSYIRVIGPDGVLVEEPSVVAIARTARGEELVAWGTRAREMWGRSASNLRVLRPVEAATVADHQAAERLIKASLGAVQGRARRRPRVLVSMPPHCSQLERRATLESVRAAGCKSVHLAPSPLLAGLGAGLSVTEPRGHLLLNVGGGRSSCSVFALGGMVVHGTESVGGVSMDSAIVRWMHRQHGVLLGSHSGEVLKRHHGTAEGGALRVMVRGRDLNSGRQREVAVSGDELCEALEPVVGHIRQTVLRTLSATPPELSADIIDTGAILAGGAAQLSGLARVLRDATNVPFLLVEQPGQAVARGLRVLLRDHKLLERLAC
jgi:rod shape-determining protein MreB